MFIHHGKDWLCLYSFSTTPTIKLLAACVPRFRASHLTVHNTVLPQNRLILLNLILIILNYLFCDCTTIVKIFS